MEEKRLQRLLAMNGIASAQGTNEQEEALIELAELVAAQEDALCELAELIGGEEGW